MDRDRPLRHDDDREEPGQVKPCSHCPKIGSRQLNRANVRVGVMGKSHVEASPSLAILLMRVDLLHLEAGRGEKKGSREIVPHRITGEVKPV